jgi:cellulose synthase/poly-beta-1,6-N-acetylglucosamine synthase-like glycosyltransferase
MVAQAPPETTGYSSIRESAVDAMAGVIVAIPAYNEARFIGSVVLQCRRYADTVLVIDDGSHDQTASIAEAVGAIVLRHEHNRGKGEGVKTPPSRKRAAWGGVAWC